MEIYDGKTRELAEQGDAEAQYRLGNILSSPELESVSTSLNAYGLKQDLVEAGEWYKKAANQGHKEAFSALIENSYELGIRFIKNNWEKTIYYFQEIQEHIDSLNICDENKALVKYSLLAEAGDAKSQYQLGLFFTNGIYIKEHFYLKDLNIAAKWYTKAAEQGYADAQYKIGICYAEGKGVKQDCGKAIEWYTKAAEQNHIVAQYHIGMYYLEGKDIEDNWQKAIGYFKAILSELDSLPISADSKEFVKNAVLADQGEAVSQYLLALNYEQGKGILKNNVKAFEWYKKSADQGCIMAIYSLGICYEQGIGVEKNWESAVACFKEILSNPDILKIDGELKTFVENAVLASPVKAVSQYALGLFYERHGINNKIPALKWYLLASEQGFEPARKKAKEIQTRIGNYRCGAHSDYNEPYYYDGKWYLDRGEYYEEEFRRRSERETSDFF